MNQVDKQWCKYYSMQDPFDSCHAYSFIKEINTKPHYYENPFTNIDDGYKP